MLKTIKTKLFLLFVLFIFSISSRLYCQDKKSQIAVAELEAKGISGMDASIVGDFLREGLVNTNKFTMVERNNMEQILSEQKFQFSGCTTQECAVKMGKILNVEKIIVGSVSKLGDMYYVSVRTVDVEKGEVTYADTGETDSMKDLRTACMNLANRIAEFETTGKRQAKVPASIRQPEPQKPALEPSPQVSTKSSSKANDVDMFFDIFTGRGSSPKANLIFKNNTYPIDEVDLYLNLNGTDGLEHSYTVNKIQFRELEMTGSAPVGMRMGMYHNYIGVSYEISYVTFSSIKQKTTAEYDNGKPIGFSFYNDDYIKLKSLNILTGDLLLRMSKRSVQPYIGIGLGLALNTVTADHIYGYSGGVFKTPLKETGVGLVVRIPMGMRIKLGDNFHMFVELRTSSTSLSFDRGIKSEEDYISVESGNMLFGASFKM